VFDQARRVALGLVRFWRDLGDRNFNLVSAGVAFFAMLAVFPAVAAIIALWGFWADPVFILTQIELASDFMPSEAFVVVEAQVGQLVAANSSTLGITSLLSLLAAAWSARRGVAAMMMGLNAIHGVPHRDGLAHALRAQLLTLMLIAVALVALACFLVLPLLLAVFPTGSATAATLLSARWGIALGTVAVGLAILYRFGPNYRPGQRIVILPGLVMAIAIWGGASVAFSVFLSNFGNYNEVYGSIGAAVALMMWFYLSAYAVLLGAALNAETLRLGQ
jgi:membrane protein